MAAPTGSGSFVSPGPAQAADAPARLRAVVLKLGRRLRSVDAGADLTPTELSVLGTVVRRGPLRPSDLSRVEALNPTMLSRVLQGLAGRGLLRRRELAADRRGVLVEATADGRRLHQRLRAERAAAIGRALEQLGEGEQRAVMAALPALEALEVALRRERS